MNLHSTGRKPNRLMRSLLLMSILIMLLASGSSCVSKGTYEKLASERTSIQSELTATKAVLSSITNERDRLNSELTATKAGLSSITAQRDSLNSQLTAATASLSSMTTERDKLSNQLTSTNASLASMAADRDKLTSQLATANASLSSMTAERDKLSNELTALRTAPTPTPTPTPSRTPMPTPTPTPAKLYRAPPPMTIDTNRQYIATIKTNFGDIVVQLFAKDAPLAVNNFVFLAREGFYNGVKFHRVVKGFVIQSGDPTGTGTGGPGYSFADEPVTKDYVPGTLAMANAGPNTNGSQFFITLADLRGTLPKSYTIFGLVTGGFDVVQRIGDVPVIARVPGGEVSFPSVGVYVDAIIIEER